MNQLLENIVDNFLYEAQRIKRNLQKVEKRLLQGAKVVDKYRENTAGHTHEIFHVIEGNKNHSIEVRTKLSNGQLAVSSIHAPSMATYRMTKEKNGTDATVKNWLVSSQVANNNKQLLRTANDVFSPEDTTRGHVGMESLLALQQHVKIASELIPKILPEHHHIIHIHAIEQERRAKVYGRVTRNLGFTKFNHEEKTGYAKLFSGDNVKNNDLSSCLPWFAHNELELS